METAFHAPFRARAAYTVQFIRMLNRRMEREKRMHLHVIAALLLGSTTLCFAQNAPNWSYEGKTGPVVWGKLDPSYQACSKGHEQSPSTFAILI